MEFLHSSGSSAVWWHNIELFEGGRSLGTVPLVGPGASFMSAACDKLYVANGAAGLVDLGPVYGHPGTPKTGGWRLNLPLAVEDTAP